MQQTTEDRILSEQPPLPGLTTKRRRKASPPVCVAPLAVPPETPAVTPIHDHRCWAIFLRTLASEIPERSRMNALLKAAKRSYHFECHAYRSPTWAECELPALNPESCGHPPFTFPC
jgi:hypothetical protein